MPVADQDRGLGVDIDPLERRRDRLTQGYERQRPAVLDAFGKLRK